MSLLSRVELVETRDDALGFDPEIQSTTHQPLSVEPDLQARVAERVKMLFVCPETLRDLVNDVLDLARSPDKVVLFEG